MHSISKKNSILKHEWKLSLGDSSETGYFKVFLRETT